MKQAFDYNDAYAQAAAQPSSPATARAKASADALSIAAATATASSAAPVTAVTSTPVPASYPSSTSTSATTSVPTFSAGTSSPSSSTAAATMQHTSAAPAAAASASPLAATSSTVSPVKPPFETYMPVYMPTAGMWAMVPVSLAPEVVNTAAVQPVSEAALPPFPIVTVSAGGQGLRFIAPSESTSQSVRSPQGHMVGSPPSKTEHAASAPVLMSEPASTLKSAQQSSSSDVPNGGARGLPASTPDVLPRSGDASESALEEREPAAALSDTGVQEGGATLRPQAPLLTAAVEKQPDDINEDDDDDVRSRRYADDGGASYAMGERGEQDDVETIIVDDDTDDDESEPGHADLDAFALMTALRGYRVVGIHSYGNQTSTGNLKEKEQLHGVIADLDDVPSAAEREYWRRRIEKDAAKGNTSVLALLARPDGPKPVKIGRVASSTDFELLPIPPLTKLRARELTLAAVASEWIDRTCGERYAFLVPEACDSAAESALSGGVGTGETAAFAQATSSPASASGSNGVGTSSPILPFWHRGLLLRPSLMSAAFNHILARLPAPLTSPSSPSSPSSSSNLREAPEVKLARLVAGVCAASANDLASRPAALVSGIATYRQTGRKRAIKHPNRFQVDASPSSAGGDRTKRRRRSSPGAAGGRSPGPASGGSSLALAPSGAGPLPLAAPLPASVAAAGASASDAQ